MAMRPPHATSEQAYDRRPDAFSGGTTRDHDPDALRPAAAGHQPGTVTPAPRVALPGPRRPQWTDCGRRIGGRRGAGRRDGGLALAPARRAGRPRRAADRPRPGARSMAARVAGPG